VKFASCIMLAEYNTIPCMATKNKPRNGKRKARLVALGLRVDANEARLIRKAARNAEKSANNWMSTHLVALAKQELTAAVALKYPTPKEILLA
jgi:uncharacterized protein (DUF1778 family)